MNEAQTRKKIIDKLLAEAGWNVNEPTQVVTEYFIDLVTNNNQAAEPTVDYQNNQKYKLVDYVLLGKDGKPLAVLEAKKASKDAAAGKEQAEQYCRKIATVQGHPLPFCMYSNGNETYFWNLDQAPPVQVLTIPSREELERYRSIRDNKKNLANESINTKIAGRGYQQEAIRAVTEGIAKGKQKFLLVMATGTGKTRTAIALVDLLMRANWVKRTLFLVDRIALRNQALDAFAEHLPNEPRWPKPGEKRLSTERRVFVATYPTMLNIIEKKQISSHFFDLVVIDESHRSVYNKYKDIPDYFNALKLGLTATPTEVIDHNTFELFGCENGKPTFAYSLTQAIEHDPPYLCDYSIMKIRTRFQELGINERTITLEDQKRLLKEGKEPEEFDFEGKDLEKKIINRGTNVAIVQSFMENCIKDSAGVIPGKTIFFCSSIAHAHRINKIFDDLYPEYKGDLARVFTSDNTEIYGKGGLLDQFKNQDMPRVAISVALLDTGIDVPEVVNLVFAKPVYSFTRFWQMIGRGTRLLNPLKLRTWCNTKKYFLMMDCWDNFEHFKLEPEGKELKPTKPLPLRFAKLRIDKIAAALEQGELAIAQKEAQLLREQIGRLPAKSVKIREAQGILQKLKPDAFWQGLSHKRLEWLRAEVLPLFKAMSQADFDQMRLRKEVLSASLEQLLGNTQRKEMLQEGLQELLHTLPMKVNIVARQGDYIRRAMTATFWENIQDGGYDEFANVIAPLIKFIDHDIEVKPAVGPVKANFFDPVQTIEMVEFGPENEGIHIEKYQQMVQDSLEEMVEQNTLLQKLKAGEELNPAEAQELAQALYQEPAYITEDLLKQAYKNRQAHFVEFIKHILGIAPLVSFGQRVSQAVEEFKQRHPQFNQSQLRFLDLLRDFILKRGNIERRHLIEAPFTVIHPRGVQGIFSPQEVQDIIQLAQQFAA